jgi:hypothetical protein
MYMCDWFRCSVVVLHKETLIHIHNPDEQRKAIRMSLATHPIFFKFIILCSSPKSLL